MYAVCIYLLFYTAIQGIEPLLAACLALYWLPSRSSTTQQASMPAVKLVALFTIVIGVFASTWTSGTCQSPTFVAAGLAAAASNVIRNSLIKTTPADPQQMLNAFSFSTFLALLSLPVSSAAESIWHGSTSDISSLLSSNLPAIGITSMIYNAASVYVCAAVSLVAHSLFTVLKRPISVGLAAAAGGLLLTQQMVFGNIISAIGLFLYSRKSRSPLASKITYAVAAISLLCTLSLHKEDTSSMRKNSLDPVSSFSARSATPVRVGFYYPLRPADTNNWTIAVDTSGGNVGNLVWFAGTRALVDKQRTEYVELWDEPEPVDAAIFTTANMLWNQTQLETPTESAVTNFWMQRLTKSIRAAPSVPLVVTGLGSNGHFTPTTINPGEAYTDLEPHGVFEPRPDLERYSAPAKDLLKALHERKASVFARGTYTCDAARSNGYSDAVPAGCPSLFLSSEVRLGQKLARAYSHLPSKLAAGTMRFAVPLPPAYRPQLFNQAIDIIEQYPGSVIVMQDWRDVKHMNKAIKDLQLSQSTLDLIKAQSRYYTSVEDWQDSYRHVDAVFSWRIHGAMVGISIGLPVFVVAPDMRVAELCEAMAIPWSTVLDPAFSDPNFDAGAYLANVKFDGEAFDANRSRLANLYLDAFASAGIPPSRHLRAIGMSRR